MLPFCSLYNFQITNLSVYENWIPLEVVLTCSETSEEAFGSSIVCYGKWTMMLNESLGILVLQCFARPSEGGPGPIFRPCLASLEFVASTEISCCAVLCLSVQKLMIYLLFPKCFFFTSSSHCLSNFFHPNS